ncbi:hypothetical protein C464_14220 [Halorubrum coriense DSM 10284]|uniref:Big-1 domain-containing protein n=1 Tax=Halorubrum coriense DSM 10284 TaxID=1227466 RepID=M0EC85_9EURY|nr:hypothetical protein [Halorubrum coriense]ELZ43999.1 hypothetical protein C464_14220 [Halorubrum coriense DSM 10284]
MRFSRDRRGQSVVVGTVILFGFLILALGIYQVQVVPTENANVEFEHSQTVEDDFSDLRNDILRASSTGSTGSTQVRLGTRYPARTFFVNPPPVSGSLSTEATGAIRIRNATVGGGAHPNAAAFWDTNRTFETRSLRYDARYNEFRDAPELVSEHSVVAAEFDDAVLLRTGQTVVSDDRIALTALTGSVSESGVTPRSVDPRAVSASDTTVPLDPSGGNVTLELPTAVENASALAARWNRALPATATATPNATGDALRITLDNGSDPYRLALSEVSLDASGTTEPAYIVSVGSETAAVGESVGVEVRDRYNNPVPDAIVSFGGENRTTGDDGRAFFEPTASGPLTATINGTAGPTYESVAFDVSAGGVGSGNRTYDVEWDEIDPIQIEQGTDDGVLDISVSDFASDAPIDGAAVDVALSPIGDVDGIPSFQEPPETNADGQTVVTQFDTNGATAGDNFTLYAASGDDVGRLVVEVVASTTPYDIVSVNPQSGGGNAIDVFFDIDTTDQDAQIRVQSLRGDGSIRDETDLLPYDEPQPVTIGGGNQAVEVRVILYDGAGNEEDQQTVPYP